MTLLSALSEIGLADSATHGSFFVPHFLLQTLALTLRLSQLVRQCFDRLVVNFLRSFVVGGLVIESVGQESLLGFVLLVRAVKLTQELRLVSSRFPLTWNLRATPDFMTILTFV